MAEAAYCSECRGYVWVGQDGGCYNGHLRSCLRDVHVAAELPTPVGVPPAPEALAAQDATTSASEAPRRTDESLPSDGVPADYSPAETTSAGSAPADVSASNESGFTSQGTPLDSETIVPPVTPPVDPREAAYGDPSHSAYGDPLSGMATDPYGYYMPPRAAVNAANTRNTGVRIVAYIIDFILVGAVQSVIGFFVGLIVGMSALTTGGDPTATVESAPVDLTLYGLGTLIFFGYFIIMEAGFGYTLGKRIFGLRVVNEDGETISWGQSFGRNLMRIVDLLFWGLVGIISMSSSDLHQRLGDRVAKTYVIR